MSSNRQSTLEKLYTYETESDDDSYVVEEGKNKLNEREK